MGRKPSNYSKTIIYKIKCNDENVLEFYVGHTTNYPKRKYNHKSELEQGNKQKVYEMIRANGGWENWTMVEVEVYPCNSSVEARIREEYWRETLQATMNARRAYLSEEARLERHKQTKAQWYQEHSDEIKIKKKQYRQEHADEIKTYTKQYRQEHKEEIAVKMKAYRGQKFECDCGTICGIGDKARHERTLKHQDWEKTNKNISSQIINEC